jgi:magnesium transporter
MSKHRFFHIANSCELKELTSAAEALACLQLEGYIWLDYHNPSWEDVSSLIEPLRLHPLAVEDCFDEQQVPKYEEFPEHLFILFNAYKKKDTAIVVDEMDFFVSDKFLVSVHGRTINENNFDQNILTPIKKNLGAICRGPAYLLHIILDITVDKKMPVIEEVQEEINQTEETILSSSEQIERADIAPQELIISRRQLLLLRKSLLAEREVLGRISRGDSPLIPSETIPHFRDISDHLAKYIGLVETNREIVSGLMETHLSFANTRMAIEANQTNRVVKRITMLTAIFMPVSILTGIGGMSEWTMMTGGEQNWKLSYPLFSVICLLVGLITYRLIHRMEQAATPVKRSRRRRS